MSEHPTPYLVNRDAGDEPQPPALPPPGLALDRLVAERVMGFDLSQPEWAWGVDSYSTKIDQAWQVVERMRALGWCGELNWHDDDTRTTYCARFMRAGARHEAAFTAAAPHALCLAALAALEVPHGQ